VTTLACFAQSVPAAIDLKLPTPVTGTLSPNDRRLMSWSGFTLDCGSAGDAVSGIRMGRNYRSLSLVQDIRIQAAGHYGLWHDADNWIIGITRVELDQCGKRTVNSCGYYATPGIASLNDIEHNRFIVEGCGRSDSTAGGILLTNTTGVWRGWIFNACDVEGNFGTDELYCTNIDAMTFTGQYLERTNIVGRLAGFEFSNCSGVFDGGLFAAELGAPLYALQFKNNSIFTIDGLTFSSWSGAAVDVQTSSRIRFGENKRLTLRTDATAETLGYFSPIISADKNGVNQSIPSSVNFTKISFSTTRIDRTTCFDTGLSRATPKTSGSYSVSARVCFAAMVDAKRVRVSIRVNGVDYRIAEYQSSGTGRQSFSISDIVPISASGSYVEVWVSQETGASQNIDGTVAVTSFSMNFLE
jgi:hypothetical protein